MEEMHGEDERPQKKPSSLVDDIHLGQSELKPKGLFAKIRSIIGL